MDAQLSNLVNRLNDPILSRTAVIPWSCPIPSFGDLSNSKIATLGLNPSNREFVDASGNELEDENRRFHTLGSLGLEQWSDVNKKHLRSINDLCRTYFNRNPYDGWFKRLDYLISGTQMSYYNTSAQACHLDLIPYATVCKWTGLTSQQRLLLLELTGDTLGLLLKESPVQLLILNGKTVVENFQKIAGIQFESKEMPNWNLPRKSKKSVAGFSYKSLVKKLGGVELKHEIAVLGYNHNIQSSFGVTNQVQSAIRDWISSMAKKVFA